MFDKILPYLLSGISVGGQYALIAIGYPMVSGILRLLHFAHGVLFMIAGFIMLYASASMPLVSRIVEIDGVPMLDGGISDSIPLEFFEKNGYAKNIVVLTKPEGYVKKSNKAFPLIKRALKKYPAAVEASRNRHMAYNASVEYDKNAEKEGRAIVICPPQKLPVGRITGDAEKLRLAYDIGRRTALENLDRIKEFLS